MMTAFSKYRRGEFIEKCAVPFWNKYCHITLDTVIVRLYLKYSHKDILQT